MDDEARDEGLVEKLQALVRIPTVSHADEAAIVPEPFESFIAKLAELFPHLHERLTLHRVRDHSLLFHWQGSGDGDPVVLMAHIDVVPVEASAPWQHPAFAAEIHDGQIWGRGTLDDKGSLVGICAAIERLLDRDVVPTRDIWLSFGAREEVSGPDATAAVDQISFAHFSTFLPLRGSSMTQGVFAGGRGNTIFFILLKEGRDMQ